jgi:hypothetical protein
LSNIITGRAGGGPFAVYASTIEEIQEPKRVHVRFQTKDVRSRVSVFGMMREDKKQGIRAKGENNLKISLLKRGLNLFEIQ